jgi:glycosyltransferase involved in cell wall biosynthesis
MTYKLTGNDVCFIGLGRSVPCWYRIALPATQMGSDWVGMSDKPPGWQWVTGNSMTDGQDYQVYVVQQPNSAEHLQWIRRKQREGAVVLADIDDYVHGAKLMLRAGEVFKPDRKLIRLYEICMEACDGVIVSTEFLRDRYEKYAKRIWVCRNGIDLGRYHVHRPERDKPTIGWFGGQGHEAALDRWKYAIDYTMEATGATFVVIGHQYDLFNAWPEDRLLRIPFVRLENFPAALANIDVAIAPADGSDFFRGKSDLRFLECGASRIAGVFDGIHYNVPPGCGFQIADPDEAPERIMQLLDDPQLRMQMGCVARAHVETLRSDEAVAHDWVTVFNDVALEVME